jgi:hypothetical protein
MSPRQTPPAATPVTPATPRQTPPAATGTLLVCDR